MLPRKYRLPATQRMGKTSRYITSYFTLKVAVNDVGTPRFAAVVSKKIDKRAVVRNRIRRQFQACFLEVLPSLAANVDILCIASKNCLDVSTHELCGELLKVLSRKEVQI